MKISDYIGVDMKESEYRTHFKKRIELESELSSCDNYERRQKIENQLYQMMRERLRKTHVDYPE
jgi:uncharacterized cysteine cluster protein YcgN (CxxCxxCC family)